MSTINTNISSLIAQRSLAVNNKNLTTSLQRLSTGLKINTGADDPAGLIASLSFQQENTGLTTAISNASRASNVVGTAEGGLSEVSNLLTQLQGLIGQAANTGGLSSSEISANQLQVDSILNTINRVAGNTNFEGTKLLNGNLDYSTSGVATGNLQNVQINSALVPSSKLSVTVAVVASAKTASISSTQTTVTGGTVTLQIGGNLGSTQLSFASGTTVSSIVTAINGVKSQTGLSATLSGSDLKVNSQGYGSSQFVSIKATSGTFALGSNNASGTDAKVNVNGSQATVDGLNVSYRSAGLDLSLSLAKAFNKSGSSTFSVTGGGATFALGDKVNDAGKASLGIADVSTASLGDQVNGFLNTLGTGGANALSSSNLSTAQNIITQAITQVSNLRGRLGSFQKYTITSTTNALNVAFENASAAQSAIQDTNFAEATSNLTRSQILAQASTTVLAQANAAPQQALTLLRGG